MCVIVKLVESTCSIENSVQLSRNLGESPFIFVSRRAVINPDKTEDLRWLEQKNRGLPCSGCYICFSVRLAQIYTITSVFIDKHRAESLISCRGQTGRRTQQWSRGGTGTKVVHWTGNKNTAVTEIKFLTYQYILPNFTATQHEVKKHSVLVLSIIFVLFITSQDLTVSTPNASLLI